MDTDARIGRATEFRQQIHRLLQTSGTVMIDDLLFFDILLLKDFELQKKNKGYSTIFRYLLLKTLLFDCISEKVMLLMNGMLFLLCCVN